MAEVVIEPGFVGAGTLPPLVCVAGSAMFTL